MKEKIIVSNLEMEPREDGMKVLRVTLQKGDKTYLRGARYSDYIDEKKRKSLFRLWAEDIAKIEGDVGVSENEIKGKIKALKGEEVTDE